MQLAKTSYTEILVFIILNYMIYMFEYCHYYYTVTYSPLSCKYFIS